MDKQWRLVHISALLLLMVCVCASCSPPAQKASDARVLVGSSHALAPPTASVVSFSFAGDARRSYTIRSTSTMSKLRHGHREFTINLADAHASLIIAFFGYSGPATYTLTNRINGGDVRIALDQQYWDLSLVPTASCTLKITADTPLGTSGVDHMRGSFICPMLPAGMQNQSSQSIAVTDSQIDILITVES